jgi:general secretion pathway protein I
VIPARKTPARGLALIEVLVGMAILAIVLIGAMRALGVNTDTQQAVTTRSLALMSADNMMNELYMQYAWPTVGTRSAPCPQMNLPLVCEQRVSNSANPNFRRIDITVYLDEGTGIAPENRTKLAWLTALLPNIRGGNF